MFSIFSPAYSLTNSKLHTMNILQHIALCFPQNNSLKSWLRHWFMERVGLDSIEEDERTCPSGVMMSRAHKAHCSQHSLNSLWYTRWPEKHRSQCLACLDGCCYAGLIEQGLTSHQTHYRSYRGRFLQVIWPNQQCQSTEGSQLALQIRLEFHQHHSTVLQ